jgi:hypothetical protein
MMRTWLVLLVGLAVSMLGTATATDLISLREVVHSIPVVSTVVFSTREAMGTSLAHALEPTCAVLGAGVMVLSLRISAAQRRIRVLEPQRA